MENEIELKIRPAMNGLKWMTDSFKILFKAPKAFAIIFFGFFVGMFMLNLIPFLGQLLIQILTPIAMAGIYAFSQSVENGQVDFDFSIIKSPFDDKEKLTQLVLLGIMNIVLVLGGMFIFGLIFVGLLAGMGITSGLGGSQNDVANLMNSLSTLNSTTLLMLITTLLLAITFFFIIGAAQWLAVPLIVFGGLTVIPALKQSLFACFRNVLSTLIFGITLVVAIILSMITLGLGLIIVVPVMMISTYVAYKDIFE